MKYIPAPTNLQPNPPLIEAGQAEFQFKPDPLPSLLVRAFGLGYWTCMPLANKGLNRD